MKTVWYPHLLKSFRAYNLQVHFSWTISNEILWEHQNLDFWNGFTKRMKSKSAPPIFAEENIVCWQDRATTLFTRLKCFRCGAVRNWWTLYDAHHLHLHGVMISHELVIIFIFVVWLNLTWAEKRRPNSVLSWHRGHPQSKNLLMKPMVSNGDNTWWVWGWWRGLLVYWSQLYSW